MDRRQLGITVTAIALALVLGVGITLLATSSGDDDGVTTGGASTTTTSSVVSSTSTTTSSSTLPPIVTVPTRTPGTVVIIPPTTTTTSTTKPRRAPRPRPTTTTAPPATVAPQATAAPTTPTPPTTPPTTRAPTPATTAPAPTTTTTVVDGRTDVGITATQIRLAVIADDVDVLEGARAWAGALNRRGGIAGRRLRLDLLQTNGTTEGYAAAVTTACTRDFAMVAGLSAFDADTAPLDCGIPDIPIEAIAPAHALHDTTYAAFPRRPQTQAVGAYRYFQSAFDDCCAQYVLVPEGEPDRSVTEAAIDAATEIGFETVATPDIAVEAPPTDYDAVAEDLLAGSATFVSTGLGGDSTIALRSAADRAGVTGVDAWYCDARCYDGPFLGEGGTTVEGEFVAIETVPFSDRREVLALREYLRAAARDGGSADYDGLRAYVAGVLFEEAAGRVVADPETGGRNALTRARLVDALAGIDDFTADGIIGPTDVAARRPTGCTVVLQVRDGRFARAHPAASGNLDCDAQNLVDLDD